MTLRTYWCVLQQAEQRRSGIRWNDMPGFRCDLDLELANGTLSGLRAALITGIRQADGDETATSWYRLNVYDADGNVAFGDYVVPPDFPVPESLAEYSDRQLIAELERRLWGR